MKCKRLLLMLLVALCAPWAAMAQEFLTVYDNDGTSSYVPTYGKWADDYTKCEFVMPAEDATNGLSDMEGGTIIKMKFYIKSIGTNGSGWNENTFQVFLKEIEATTISAWQGTNDATIVYEGTLPNPAAGEYEITFTNGYEYNGGNLLVGIYNTTSGKNYKTATFYGKSVSGASGSNYSSSSLSGVSFSQKDFLPKTTFTYTPGSSTATAPGVTTSETVANLTNTSVTLGGTITDMGGASGVYAGICYSTTATPTTSDGHAHIRYTAAGPITQNFTGLLPSTKYYYRAYAYNSANSLADPTYGDIYSFTTAGNITITQPANGEISVSVAGGTPTTSSTYALPGESVTLTATAADGYNLDCWNVTGVTGEANGNTYTFTMPSNSVSATASIVPTPGGSSSEFYYALASSVESGEKYLIVRGNSSTISGSTTFYAMERNNTTSTSGTLDYGTPTFKDSEKQKITGITPHTSGHALSEFVWTITASGSDYTISAENGGSTYYLIETSSNDGNLHSYTTSNSNYNADYINWTINTTSNDGFIIHNPYWHTNNTTYYYYLYYSGGFKNYYSSTTPANITSASYRMYLYKETSATTYAITATASPSEGGTVDGSDYYASGSSCTLTATPAFGYDFVSWTEGGVVVSTNEEYTFTVSSARTLVANFETQGSCIKPTDLAQVGPQAAHQAQLSWTENSGATQWQVVYSTDSEFNPDDATPVTVNENPATITTGLNQASTYYFRVRAICDQNSQSGWSNQGTFSTISGHLAPTVSYDPTTLSTHEVTVTWTGVATNVLHQSYDLYYSTNSVMPETLDPTTFIVGLTGNSHPLTDLTSGTQYYVWVRDNCGDDGYSDWSTPESFITVCEPRTITDAGWGENFNGYAGTTYNTAGVMPNCWDAYTTNTYKPHVINTSSSYYNYSTTNALVMPGGSNYSYVALPEFTNDLQTLQISFKYGFYDYYYGTLNLGYIKENDVNFSTFTPFKDFTATTDGTLVESGDVYLQTLPTDAYRLAFRYDDDYGYSYYVCNIEDVVISLIPTCWQPQNLAASEVTNESAKLTWERHAMGDETAWVLQYSEDNTFATCTTKDVETNPTYTIENGLTASTTYYARVKPACDTEGNLWSEVIEFETEPDCAVPTGLAVTPGSETPYGATITWNGRNDSFVVEYGTVGETTVTTLLSEDFESSSSFPTGWSTTTTNWEVSSYNYAGGAGPNEAELYYDDYASTPTRLITPALDLTGLTSVNLSFKHYVNVYKSNSCTFGVATSSDGGTTWNTGWTKTYSSDDQETINVASFTTPDMGKANVLFCFYYNSSLYNIDNWYIDDILIKAEVPGDITWHSLNEGTVENTTPGEVGTFSYTFNDATLFEPSTTYAAHVKGACGSKTTTDFCEPVYFTTADDCPVPTEFAVSALTSTTATVTWNGGFATEWKVWIKKSTDTSYPSDPAAIVTTPTKTFDGNLEDGTRYDVKIAPTCDETKALEVLNAFTTRYGIPFVETFETDAIPANWARYTGSVAAAFSGTNPTTTTGGWVFDNNNVFGQYHTSVNIWSDYTYWLTTPNIDLTTATDASKLYLVFDLAITDYDEVTAPGAGEPADNDQFRVLVSTNGGATWIEDDSWVWMNEGGDYVYSDIPNTGQTIMLPLANYATGSVMIAFYAESGSGTSADFDIHIDNVKVGEVATYQRTIKGHNGGEGGYALVATPVGTIYSFDMANTNMIADPAVDYDLYYFDQSQDLEWINYKDTEHGGNFNLTTGKGYLYANKNTVNLTFTGIAYSGTGVVDLSYNDNAEFAGWNLIGNPYATAATLNKPFYKMNETGDGFTAQIEDLTTIAAMEGVFVQVTESGQSATFTAQTSKGEQQAIAHTNIVLSGNKGKVLDNAIIRFDNGETLGKFSFRENNAKVYIPMEGKDYAVVNAGHVGEIPVSFVPESNGTYSLSFTSEEVTFSYLHLIDNMTGNDVNLLETPSYTFDARTSDYESRFRLVFATGSSASSDTFGFVNASGNFCIFGIEGEATVQVIDVLGHVLSSETFSGSYERKINGAPGVYMVRLIQGNDVKVQKVVVR